MIAYIEANISPKPSIIDIAPFILNDSYAHALPSIRITYILLHWYGHVRCFRRILNEKLITEYSWLLRVKCVNTISLQENISIINAIRYQMISGLSVNASKLIIKS